MGFLLGFPVDSGNESLSFIVLVRAIRAKYHWCRGGGKSELRPHSGARFAFEHAPREVQDQCRFEFEPIPTPSNTRYNKPDQICNVGYSDAAACALAIAQYRPGGSFLEISKRPVLVSCSFVPNHQLNQGLFGILLDKVTHENQEESLDSLRHKWLAAKNHQALALVLHEDDAKLLASISDFPVEMLELNKNSFLQLVKENRENPPVISCKSGQIALLAEALTINSSLFRVASHYYWPFLLKVMFLSVFVLGFSWQLFAEKYTDPTKKELPPENTLDLEAINKEEFSSFLEALTDSDPKVRLYGVWALGKLGKDATASVPDLVKRLKDDSEEVRLKTAWALGQMGDSGKNALQELLLLFEEEQNPKIRMQIVVTLGNLGQKEAIPTLLKALEDKEWIVRLEAVLALDRIGPSEECILPLIEKLNDSNKYVRRHSAWVLGNCGTRANKALQSLLAAIQDEDKYVRLEAGEAVKKIVDLEVRRRE